MTSRWTALGKSGSYLASLGVWLAIAALSGVSELHAQQKRYRPLPEYVQLGRPDQAEGQRILAEFRQKGIAGSYYLEFRLRIMPRRGADRWLDGQLWSGSSANGPILRLALLPASDAADSDGKTGETRWLVQGGLNPAMWGWSASAPNDVLQLGLDGLFNPMGGTDLTPFDLSMPFLFWTDFVFEGLRKVSNRPAHAFLLYPPDDVAEQHPGLAGIRVYLDTQFNALVQAEHIGDKGKIMKAMQLLDVKKVAERWIPKNIDFRDEATRNKTRFSVTAAALDREFVSTLFVPDHLVQAIAPPTESLTRIMQ